MSLNGYPLQIVNTTIKEILLSDSLVKKFYEFESLWLFTQYEKSVSVK